MSPVPLPDLPRWVFLHDLLHRPETVHRRRAHPYGLVAACPRRRLVATAGLADRDLVEALAEPLGDGVEIVFGEADEGRIRRLWPDWRVEAAWLYRPPQGWAPAPPDGPTRLLPEDGELEAASLPEPLAQELSWGLENTRAAVSLDGGRPVGFCWVTAQSRRWWDVSVETLAGYRRRGHASRSFQALALRMSQDGLRPLWGATVANRASSSLARRLGLVRSDRLVVAYRAVMTPPAPPESRSAGGRIRRPTQS